MKFLLTLLLFMAMETYANEVKIESNPARPVVGEVFQVYFRIFTEAEDEPVINFSPNNVEVVGKSNQGITTRTIYANGKLTVTRELTMVYELVAAKAGSASLRDINIEVGNKTIRHPALSLTILKEAEVAADVFVLADVPKQDIFLGEGIIVRYYIYSKVQLSNFDIKKYPQLNNFLKRFLQETGQSESVSVDGQHYLRNQIYSAKLFPEKLGELKIDSLHLSVTYPSSRGGDPFGAFGLNRDYKTKALSSKAIKINVRPLPAPIPPDFTGLVGNHDFQVQFGQNKLIVNEPLEVKLTVSGVGALENFEAPDLIKHPGLEEFESNGDLKISNADQATKVFDYTFLAKENLTLPGKTMSLSYFNPDTQKYVSTSLNIPEIVVAGGQARAPRKEDRPQPNVQPAPGTPSMSQSMRELSNPMTVNEWQWKAWLPVVNLSLASFAVLISLGWMIKQKKFSGLGYKTEVPSSFKKGAFSLSEFTKWLTPVIKRTGKSPLGIIKDSPLPEESKRYFIDLLSANDYKDYSSRKSQMDYKYQPGHFKELGRYIESTRNEDSSQPS